MPTPSTSRYVGAEVGLRIKEVPQELVGHAPTSHHLRNCSECREMEAQSFAELLDFSRADVPGPGYFQDYYATDGLSNEQVAAIYDRILALCKPRLCIWEHRARDAFKTLAAFVAAVWFPIIVWTCSFLVLCICYRLLHMYYPQQMSEVAAWLQLRAGAR